MADSNRIPFSRFGRASAGATEEAAQLTGRSTPWQPWLPRPGLWETVGMADKPRIYVVNKDASGMVISGHCSKCGRVFQFESSSEGRRVEKAFETHECKPEEEATEDR